MFLLCTGLAVDYFNERLYWADAKLSVIGSVRLNGSDPVVAVSNIKNSSVARKRLVLFMTVMRCSYKMSCVCVCCRSAPPVQH